MAVERSRRALKDLDEIWDYIGRDNPVMADRVLDKMAAKCEMLASQPLIGEARPDLVPNLREVPVGNYVIFYQPFSDGVVVVRVLHAARNVADFEWD